MQKDSPQIHELLTINPKNENIYSCLGRMQTIIDFCESIPKYRSITPFVKTYHIITKTVALKSLSGRRYFNDIKSLQNLDIVFANLFLQPLLKYFVNNEKTRPWKTYFDYCKRPDGIPFLQMLLGINAHINGDLAHALASAKYKNRQDFLLINKILREEIPAVMKFLLISRHDSLGLGTLAFGKLADLAFEKIIVKWREQAWRDHALLIKNPKHIIKIHANAEFIARKLIKMFRMI